MIADIVPAVRDVLSVSAAHDAKITKACERACMTLLRQYNFPKSLRFTESEPIELDANTIPLPANSGKVKGVRLSNNDADDPQYKVLRRIEPGTSWSADAIAPAYFWQTGADIVLDVPLREAGYVVQFWYQSIDIDSNETWLTTEFEDVVFNHTAYRAAPLVRKPDLQSTFGAAMQLDIQILGPYLQELEFGQLEMQLTPGTQAFVERYAR